MGCSDYEKPREGTFGRRLFFGPDKVKGMGVWLDPQEGCGKLNFEMRQLLDSVFFGAKFTQVTDERPARMGPAQSLEVSIFISC